MIANRVKNKKRKIQDVSMSSIQDELNLRWAQFEMSAFLVLRQQALSFNLFFLDHFSRAMVKHWIFKIKISLVIKHAKMSSTQNELESTFLTSPLFSVDSTPAASCRSASGLASFSGDPRACAISWPGLLDLLKCFSLGLDACSVSWLGLWPRLFFWVDSTPAASRGSAFGLASFADDPGVCGI